ncbi:MAG: ABC transporter permease [Saprospiraceae bacterium]|nr:ABC transporter permease [Saprospiraceae bacterium]
MLIFQILGESFLQAYRQLVNNRLRTFLTLLGITIGIFCIIAVLSAVDSLKDNILESFDKFGSDVVYLDKWPWQEDPGQNYWKYMARPNPGIEDLKAIEERSKLAELASLMVFIPGSSVNFAGNHVEGAYLCGITENTNRTMQLEIEEGSYFSSRAFHAAGNEVLLGYTLADALFPKGDAVGKRVRIYGQIYLVAGTLKKGGKSLIEIMPTDEAVFMPFNAIRKLVSVHRHSNWGSLLSIKARRGADLGELKEEVASIIRPIRGLKPRQPANFSLNEMTMLTNIVEGVFGVINIAGILIGMFSMLVGAFGVANIMFVTVKERTPLIGIKMALGAKRHFILLEYLLEAIALSVVGGFIGLLMVVMVLFLVSKAIGFAMSMSLVNVLTGLGLSIATGVVAGIIPAWTAARMDPVEAIRK